MRVRVLYASILALCTGVAAQPCTPYWVAMPPSPTGLTYPFVFDDGNGLAVYAAATFNWPSTAGWAVQRWNGDKWEVIRNGLPSDITNILTRILDDGSGPRLYILARRHSGLGWTSYIWTGEEWIPGPPNFVITDYSGQLVGGPSYSYDHGEGPVIYGGVHFQHSQRAITKWNGASWDIVAHYQGWIYSRVVFDDGTGPKLYFSGDFVDIGGSGVSQFARWDGTTFTQINPGTGPPCSDMVVVQKSSGQVLYCLNCANPSSPDCLRRWDGQTWTQIPGPTVPPNTVTTVRDMAVFDDGTGDALYLGGSFSVIGGVEARRIARWDGQSWSAVGNGGNGEVTSLIPFDDPRGPSLIVRGLNNTLPGTVSSGLAQWVGCPNCYANCDNSSIAPRLNVDDFICFINKFAANDPYANCDQNGAINVDDFMCFINRFAAGCP